MFACQWLYVFVVSHPLAALVIRRSVRSVCGGGGELCQSLRRGQGTSQAPLSDRCVLLANAVEEVQGALRFPGC